MALQCWNDHESFTQELHVSWGAGLSSDRTFEFFAWRKWKWKGNVCKTVMNLRGLNQNIKRLKKNYEFIIYRVPFCLALFLRWEEALELATVEHPIKDLFGMGKIRQVWKLP